MSIPRLDITQDLAITAVVNVLRTRLSLSDKNCYEVESEDQLPKIPTGGDFFLTVAPDEGRFPQEEQFTDDNGISNLTEEAGLIISGYSRIQTDPTDHAAQLLHNDKRGLLEIKRKILWAILGPATTTSAGTIINQDPVVTDPDTGVEFAFLRQMLYAIRATRPRSVKQEDAACRWAKCKSCSG